jgi:glycosyltransferase involved in cell wall biosynthesis
MTDRLPARSQRRIRVGHVLNTIGLGGVPEAAWQLMRRLPQAQFDQQVYVLSAAKGHEEHRQQRLAQFCEAGARVTIAGAGSNPTGHTETWYGRLGDLVTWLRHEQLDIVHTHSYKPNLQGRMAAALLRSHGLRVVAHYHNTYDDKWEKDGTGWLDALLCRDTDALLACSSHVAMDVAMRLGLGPEAIHVLPNGVDLGEFNPVDASVRQGLRKQWGVRPDQALVACVGRLSRQKGQDVFLRAAALVRARHPDAAFLVVGAPDDTDHANVLASLAAELGLTEPQLRFTGRIASGADMANLYRAIDLLVAPSRWEGFGLMLVEAMACACPILATRVGAIPEVVQDGTTSVLVEPDEPGDLAHAMATLLAAPERRREMGRHGLDRSAEFSWETGAKRLASIYLDLVNRDRSC